MRSMRTTTGLILLCMAIAAITIIGCGGPQTTTPPPPSSSVTPPPTKAKPSGPPPMPDVSGHSFSPVDLSGSASQYRSGWTAHSRSVTIAAEGAGLRCTVVGDPASGKGAYGGVQFPAKGVKAMRLRLSFDAPDAIDAVYVDGAKVSKSGKADRQLRWSWIFDGAHLPSGNNTYIFVPGQNSGYFRSQENRDASAINRVDVFVRLQPTASQASFTLTGAEVAR
jgi:hypothetical protein